MEEWRDIVGYERLYMVSNMGRVKRKDSIINTNIKGVNKRFMKGRILKYGKNNKGYLLVNLCKDGKVKQYLIHRLVATAFIPNPNNYTVVNHKDEDKSNNRVDNLEWCTQKHNMNWNNVIARKVAPKLRKTEEEKKLNRQRYVIENKEKIKAYKHQYYKEHYIPKGKTTQKQVKQFTKNGDFVKLYISIAEASKTTNINNAHISSCCSGKRKSAGGYKWYYAS